MPKSRNRKGRKVHKVSSTSMSEKGNREHYSQGLVYGRGYSGQKSSSLSAKRYKRPKI